MSFIPVAPRAKEEGTSQSGRRIFSDEVSLVPLWQGKSVIENEGRIVILPCIDYNLYPHDSSWPTSIMPYMSPTIVDPTDGTHKALAPFASPIGLYDFVGSNNDTILSPASKLDMLGGDSLPSIETADAFRDITKHVWNSSMSKDEKERLTRGSWGAVKVAPIIPKRKDKVLIQVMYRDNKNVAWTPRALFVTSTTFLELERVLRLFAPSAAEDERLTARDPDYPNYIVGDPSKIDNPYEWGFVKKKVSFVDMDANVLRFSKDGRDSRDLDADAGPGIIEPGLTSRIAPWDPKNWNFPTYQEMVNIAVEDTEIPHNLIVEACGRKADVPARKGAIASPAPVSAAPVTGAPTLAPPPSPAPPLQAQAPPVPTTETPNIWTLKQGETSPVLMTKSALQVAAQAGPMQVVVPGDATNTWVDAAVSGLLPDAIPMTPAAPPAPPVPSAPASGPAPADGGALDAASKAILTSTVPAWETTLSEEQALELAGLLQHDQTKDGPLSAENLTTVSSLMNIALGA